MGESIRLSKPYHNTVGNVVAGRKCLTFHPDQFVKLILKGMRASGIGAAGVVDDNGNLEGLLTEREILRRAFDLLVDPAVHSSNVGKRLDDMLVREAMIAAPATLVEDMAIEDAFDIMVRLGFRVMPVVSRRDRRKLIGIVDERELAIHVKNRLEHLKREAREKDDILSFFFCEPYGAGQSRSSNHPSP